MAVYKATYCQPFLNNVDIRVAVDSEVEKPCKWLTCKIDSSNRKITGYKIRILDSANNQIFPSALSNDGEGYISRVRELPTDSSDSYINSGLNGTVLKIPFFQNYNLSNMLLRSLNAVYYVPRYKADYVYNAVAPYIRVYALDADNIFIGGTTSLNGDTLVVGDKVLFRGDLDYYIEEEPHICEKGIFIVTNIRRVNRIDQVWLTRFLDIDDAALRQHEVVLTKGNLHDRGFFYDGEDWTEREPGSGTLWVDITGSPINFNIEGNQYKWEITLYQGDYENTYDVTVTIEGVDFYVSYLVYDFSIPARGNSIEINYDTVLSSGKIMGSTNKRIQIASALDDSAILPIGTLNSPLVLQGTYAQLLDSDKNPIASRAYVQSYDSSFGHVYPITDGFSKEDVAAAEKICFYKHSNNVEDILAKERVDCATTANLNIYVEVEGRWQVNTSLGLPVIDGYQTEEGTYVLVKNQTRQQENGIYRAHSAGAGWTRSGSYKNWGDFIGAIIFVINGNTNGATNWESTASAGGSLFNTDTASGDSPLIFIPEQPITLFSGRLSKNVDLVREKTPEEDIIAQDGDEVISHEGNTYQVRLCIVTPGEVKFWKFLSDGVGYSPGQRILCYNDSHKIIQIVDTEVVTSGSSLYAIITYTVVDSAETNDYINVLSGTTYGGHIVKLLSNSVVIDDDVKYAYILKNGLTHTYISPYMGLRKDMALKLLNNKKVTYEGGSTSEWINICSDDPLAKSINTTVWRIAHEQLTEPLASESSSDPLVPFAYEVRTFYRVSDENPFYICETPYLRIIRRDPLEDYSAVPARYAKFEASYRQFQQLSWESYRWLLLDHENNIIQDTGTQYDRDIKATFYGLSNEAPDNSYTVKLYVTDNLENNLSAEAAMEIAEASTTFSTNFEASLDCSTHSIILTNLFEDNDLNYSIYRREYQKYERVVHTSGGIPRLETKEYKGKWEPVLLNTRRASFRDFNIKAGHAYQYVIYPTNSSAAVQQFANAEDIGPYAGSAVPITANWDEWSLIELKPVQNSIDAPILRKTYEVDLNNIWLFKYGLETGAQNQNFQKSEVQTLGQYQKIGYGRSNYISGDVSCFLGSEIVPYSKNGYIERMRKSIEAPLSTNEKAFMLEQWRKIAFSPNPKLLRDMKGQSWIVQIMSNNNTPNNFYPEHPDTISFSWKQIDSTDNVIIVGDGTELPEICGVDSIWRKII